MTRAALVEVFASYQGEGPTAGQPTLFVRTAGCPIRCVFCDTPEGLRIPRTCRFVSVRGERTEVPNPVAVETLRGRLPDCTPAGTRWLALTGGEPLLHPDFGRELFEAAATLGLARHLETAALDAGALRRLLPAVDFLAADWKLPSAVGGEDLAERHLACLEAALAAGVETAVKIVLFAGAPEAEFAGALAALRPFARHFTLVLQPATPVDGVAPPAPAALTAWARRAQAQGFELRLLPQVHPVLGLD